MAFVSEYPLMPSETHRRLALVLALAASSCGGGEGDGGGSAPAPPAGDEPTAAAALDPRLSLYAAADRRELAPAMHDGLRSPDPTLRLAAVEALSRLREPEAFERLRAALRDPDARVRLAASFGLSLLEPVADGPASPEPALLGAAAAALADPRPDRAAEVAAHIRDLGRIGAGASLPALRAALDHESAEVRLAATDALAAFGRRQVPASDDFHAALLERAARDSSRAVKAGAARALGALAPPVPAAIREELRRGLVAALDSTEPAVAALLARALLAYPPVPVAVAARLAGSDDPGLAAEGIRLLAAAGHEGDAPLAAALSALDARARRGSRGDRTLLADALGIALPAARSEATHRAAVRIFEGFRGRTAPTLPDALAHCAAAELVDRGRGWPARTPGCGLGLTPADLGARRSAAILRDVPGEDALRANFLGRLYRAGPNAVRAAVLDALVGLPFEHARPFLLEGLTSGDIAVVSAALRLAIHHRPAILATQDGPALSRGLAAARPTLAAAADAPGLALFAEAAGAIPDGRHATVLRELSASPNRAVRDAARRALRAFPGTEPAPAFPPAPHAITPDALSRRSPHARYRVHTTVGAFDLELDAAAAPVTTARFQELVGRQFYDGLAFHARSPGFVVQGGDPRSDGHGGPGYTVRDEPSRCRFERGTVGLALAGPDTGGSQFFITLADQPQLEGRYTAFARVVAGMDVVDRLVPGETIERIEPAGDAE